MRAQRRVRRAGHGDAGTAWRRSLLAWTREPAPGRGIRFAGAGEDWEFWAYERLAAVAFGVARGLVEAGVQPGQVVSIILRSGPDFATTLIGTMLAGAIPSPVAPRLAFQDAAAHDAHVATILASADPALVVTDAEQTASRARALWTGGRCRVVTPAWLRDLGGDRMVPPDRRAADLALLQFTSGSSGAARGVRVPFAALEANIAAIHRWLGWSRDDASASWLPLHHDMGLVGCLLGSLVAGTDLWLLRPEQFVHRPQRFLRCLGGSGATMAASPAFGLEYVLRRVSTEQLEGCDFGSWRILIVGAERIDPHLLERFGERLAPFGFTSGALRPAYGLAEATLAVTGLARDEHWTGLTVDPGSLAPGREARLADRAGGQRLAGCGAPLPGTRVTIVGPDGARVPDRHVGEIVVTGPSVAAGYLGPGASTSSTRFTGEALHTGDAGFMSGGQLYVIGRLGDSVRVRGTSLFAEQLEGALGETGASPERLAVLLGVHHGEPHAVVLLERQEAARATAAARLVSRRADGVAVVVVELPNGGIARTSSGKPKRRQLWQSFTEGTLRGTLVGSTPASPGPDAGDRGLV